MTDLNKTIEYVFKLRDNISAAAGQMAQELDRANEDIHIHEQNQEHMARTTEAVLVQVQDTTQQVTSEQQALQAEMDLTKDKAETNQMTLLTQLTSIMALKEGVSAVTGGMIALGYVSDDTAKTLMKVNAGFQLFAGVVQTLKAVQGVMTTLNVANAVGASIDTYRAALQNPLAIGAIGLASGAALGVGAALLMNRGGGDTTNNTTTNITVQDTTPVQATSQIFQVVEGGAL